AEVTEALQATAWDHPYHSAGARYAIQHPHETGAEYRPVATRSDLQARDAGTWAPSGGLVATWIIRPAGAPTPGPAIRPDIAGETCGVEILYMVGGSASVCRHGGEDIRLEAGDTLTVSLGLVGYPT